MANNLQNAKTIQPTSGELKYTKARLFIGVDSTGSEWDLSILDFGDSKNYASHVIISNYGDSDVYVAFDVDVTSIDTSDWTTYNWVLLSSASDIDAIPTISQDGNANKIAFKCASGQTTNLQVFVR